MKYKIEDLNLFEKLPYDFQEFLRESNGIVLFDGGLHIRGASYKPKWHSLRTVWMGDLALYKTYSNLDENDIPFGQDCLGDQFILREGIVYKLYAETGDIESLNVDFKTFIKLSNDNPIEYLSLQPLVFYENEGKKLKLGQILNVYPPFCTKEAEKGISLKAIPIIERLEFLMSFYKQIFDVPDGSMIKIKIQP